MSCEGKSQSITANDRILIVYRFLDISFWRRYPRTKFHQKSLYKTKVRQALSRLPHHTRFVFSSRASTQTGYSSQVANSESLRSSIHSRSYWERLGSRG